MRDACRQTLPLFRVLPVIAMVACGSPRAPTRATVPPVAARPFASVADRGEGTGSSTPEQPPAAPPDTGVVAGSDEKVEVSCNGLDDDHDGLIDVLMPEGPNASCKTALLGACGTGIASCEGGQHVCSAPPPLPEVFDGIDNDCNGTVDDVLPTRVHSRALVVVPKYAWADAMVDIANVTAFLDQAGISFDREPVGSDWETSLTSLSDYALLIVPGYLMGAVVQPAIQRALEDFARQGGVVVVMKPVGTIDQPNAWKLLGLTSSTRHRDVSEIRFDGTPAPAFAAVDSAEERRTQIAADAKLDPIEVYTLEPDPAEKTTAIAHAFVGAKSVGPAITRRPLGQGSIYGVGHDLVTFGGNRCYVNCFEPSGDLLRLALQGALREGSRGHVALKHSAPSLANSVVVMTHDVDAPDAQNAGGWGQPGALQMAAMEKSHGVRGSYNITTDYVAGYFNPQIVHDLCSMGMCPVGAHSVRHLGNFGTHPLGTCSETRATYPATATPTLCGEVRVSTQILTELTGRAPRVWRSPYLELNPKQFDALFDRGIVIDSGYGVGDLKYNLPVDLSAVGFRQGVFHHRPILEFPISCEDGIGMLVHGVLRREELQASNSARFVALWTYIMLENAANRSITTALVHPSRGRDEPEENLAIKIAAVEQLVVAAQRRGLPIVPMEEFADFWRAREQVSLDVTFDSKSGYTGTIVTGKLPITHLTIELGDVIKSFSCPKCGPALVLGRRVMLNSTIAASTRMEFVAPVR